MMHIRFGCWLLIVFALVSAVHANEILVRDAASLRAALPKLTPGAVLRIAPGDYPGGYSITGVANLTVEAADPARPPHFKGGSSAWHFSGCSGLKLRHLRVSGQRHNGLNLDDGGQGTRPMNGVTLEHLHVSDIGPKGNFDGIKCSGLQDLTIRDCTVEGWGGEAIDMVGCHRVLVTGCRIVGKPGYSQAVGVQCKGGSADVTIENCRFDDAGQRPVNAGGSTGMPFFRPLGAKYEARRIIIRNNRIAGSPCAAAFTGVDGVQFTGNTVLFPTKWVFRILQETTAAGFVPSRNGVIADNTIVYRRSQVATAVNIGPHTAPETFRFARNRWFAEDRPDRSEPELPTEEIGGVYGVDPRRDKVTS